MKRYLITLSMLRELMGAKWLFHDKKVIIMGQTETSWLLYGSLRHRNIPFWVCTKKDTLIKFLNGSVVHKKLLFMPVGRDYHQWMKLLQENGYSRNQIMIIPFYV